MELVCTVVGLVVATIDTIKTAEQTINKISVGEKSSMVLYSSTGVNLSHTKKEEIGKNASSSPWIAQMLKDNDGNGR